jgi:hypothetical protein
MGHLWLSLGFLAVDVVGLALLFRRRLWSSLPWRWAALALGILVAAYVCLTQLPYDDRYRVVGFPLPAAAFEIRTGADFISPLTVPILALDVLLVSSFPLSLLVLVAVFRDRTSR